MPISKSASSFRISRSFYWLMMAGIYLLIWKTAGVFESLLSLTLPLALYVAGLAITLGRVNDIGWPQWPMIIIMVPIVIALWASFSSFMNMKVSAATPFFALAAIMMIITMVTPLFQVVIGFIPGKMLTMPTPQIFE